MLTIKKFSKTYAGNKKAVTELNLTVNSGEIYGFIGHNGAGKSTTIKAIVGVMDFEEGEITIDGHSIKTDPIASKQVMAYIPDNPDLYEHLTGIQYLNFISDIYEVPVALREERIKQYADTFEIMANLGDLISSYSHGMKQKTALIGALIHQPKLLVLDEPFVGLDPKASLALRGIMKELCDKGSAIFFSTHVLEVAEKICHRVGMINHGKLAFSGTMTELLSEKEAGSLEEIFMGVVNEL